jgi:hypothetical protein
MLGLAVYFAFGRAVYFAYDRRHSTLHARSAAVGVVLGIPPTSSPSRTGDPK